MNHVLQSIKKLKKCPNRTSHNVLENMCVLKYQNTHSSFEKKWGTASLREIRRTAMATAKQAVKQIKFQRLKNQIRISMILTITTTKRLDIFGFLST